MSDTRDPRVLVVDDDPDLRDLLCTYIQSSGFRAESAADGAAMRQSLARGQPDALVLDLMLPGEDGLTLLRTIRGQSDLPVLMLSARGDETDRIVGLEVGADDYMAKPFNPRELLARLRALLRRHAPPEDRAAECLCFGAFRLDPGARRLWSEAEAVELTTAEYDLLDAFLRHPNRVLTRDRLIELIRGEDRDPFDRSIDNRVTRLRRRIEADPAGRTSSAPCAARAICSIRPAHDRPAAQPRSLARHPARAGASRLRTGAGGNWRARALRGSLTGSSAMWSG
ncbi:response regulator (plasmid) [Cereibacter azotoformans]|uniref:response regulator n=1 Tax=Cereibacter azotoformans TaxID=43057 RepID=UPI003B2134FF